MMSILSAVNAVNLVNAVNSVNNGPPPGGVARAAHEVALALILSDDFVEIIDNAAAVNNVNDVNSVRCQFSQLCQCRQYRQQRTAARRRGKSHL
jgi:hypothetical protein